MSEKKREILFRGKENPSGNWIEGFLVGNCHIGDWVSCTPVHSKTVGQFTGLTDKNGTKIFEGDIVNILPEVDEIGVINWAEGEAMFVLNADGWCANFDNYYPYDVEVIGNIHDIPELLEAGTNA